jgi:hypothetical protein
MPTEVERRDGGSLLLVGQRDVGEDGFARRTREVVPEQLGDCQCFRPATY